MSQRLTLKRLSEMKNNRLNIDSKKWGEEGWIFAFACAFAYPQQPTEEEINDGSNFYSSLKSMLPCFNCRNNYSDHLKEYELTSEVLSSRVNLTKWLVNIKNAVNTSLGLPTYSHDETVNYYYNIINQPKKFCLKSLDDNVLKITVLLSVLLFLIYYLSRR